VEGTVVGAIDDYVQILKGMQDGRRQIRFLQRFLDASSRFDRVMWGLSEDFAMFYGCELQFCYENCQRIALRIPDLRYHEGYVANGGLVQEHAWLVAENGEVVEPTLALNRALADAVEEYRGVSIPTDFIKAQAEVQEGFIPLIEGAYLAKVWH